MKKKFDETDAKIEKAFADLIAEGRHLQDITVTDLVKVAGITRGTFYLHYDNINAVATEIENKLLSEFNLNSIEVTSPETLEQFFNELFVFLSRNENLYKNLLRSNVTVLFVDRISSEIRRRTLTLLKEQNIWRENLELDIYYNCDAAVQMIIHYFRNELKNTLPEIEKYISERFFRLIKDSERELI